MIIFERHPRYDDVILYFTSVEPGITPTSGGSCYRQRNGTMICYRQRNGMIDESELTTDMAMLRYGPGTTSTRSLSLMEPMRSTLHGSC